MMTAEDFLALVEKTLDDVLPGEEARPASLSRAMRYAVGSGGKRVTTVPPVRPAATSASIH